jgi:hypothetical protein
MEVGSFFSTASTAYTTLFGVNAEGQFQCLWMVNEVMKWWWGGYDMGV